MVMVGIPWWSAQLIERGRFALSDALGNQEGQQMAVAVMTTVALAPIREHVTELFVITRGIASY